MGFIDEFFSGMVRGAMGAVGIASGLNRRGASGKPFHDKGKVYLGALKSKNKLFGLYENGCIFRGERKTENQIGCYGAGVIYMGKIASDNTRLGFYSNGSIYRGERISDEYLIGRYGDGAVYKGSIAIMDTQIACYEGDDDGAAALALFFVDY